MTTTQIILSIFTAVLASSGVWSIVLFKMQKKAERQDKAEKKDTAERKMLLALAHDRIYYLCCRMLDDYQNGKTQGIDVEEYDNLRILFEGYEALGGNGTCKRLYNEVSKLPITH